MEKEYDIKFKVILTGNETTDFDDLETQLVNLCYDYGFDVKPLK